MKFPDFMTILCLLDAFCLGKNILNLKTLTLTPYEELQMYVKHRKQVMERLQKLRWLLCSCFSPETVKETITQIRTVELYSTVERSHRTCLTYQISNCT